jgi:HlyD family secretion protein
MSVDQVAPKSKQIWGALVRRGLLVLAALAVVAGFVVVWQPDPIMVDLATARRGPMRVTIDEDGRTRVKDRYLVSAPLLGNLARIELHPGDAVEPGKVLARIVPLEPPLLDERTRAQAEGRVAAAGAARNQAHATIDRVRTSLAYAQKESERQRALIGSGASAPRAAERAELEERSLSEELASAEFGARVADHELQVAQAALGRIARPRGKNEAEPEVEITSPVRGRVLRVIQESEGAVQPGQPLLEIGDPTALEIVVDVLTSDAVAIQPGAKAEIERWGGAQALPAHVRLIEPSAFTRVSALGVEEQRVNVVIDLDAPHATWSALGDGYRVEAAIEVWNGNDVLSVPASAVFRRGEGWAVFQVKNGKALVQNVEIGRQNMDSEQITRGLQAGDQVIVHPSDRVADGASVEARK